MRAFLVLLTPSNPIALILIKATLFLGTKIYANRYIKTMEICNRNSKIYLIID